MILFLMFLMVQAKAEEDNRVDMKNSELSATNDLSSVYRWKSRFIDFDDLATLFWNVQRNTQLDTDCFQNRKNPNIATGDSPPKEVGDKSSATFVSVVSISSRKISNICVKYKHLFINVGAKHIFLQYFIFGSPLQSLLLPSQKGGMMVKEFKAN